MRKSRVMRRQISATNDFCLMHKLCTCEVEIEIQPMDVVYALAFLIQGSHTHSFAARIRTISGLKCSNISQRFTSYNPALLLSMEIRATFAQPTSHDQPPSNPRRTDGVSKRHNTSRIV